MDDYTKKFEDKLDKINTYAQSRGYKNGISWAKRANSKGSISDSELKEFKRVHELRNQISHGHARDINITKKTYEIARKFYARIKSIKYESLNSDDGNSSYSSTYLEHSSYYKCLSKYIGTRLFKAKNPKIEDLENEVISLYESETFFDFFREVWPDIDPGFTPSIFSHKKWKKTLARKFLSQMYPWELDELMQK